MLETLYVYFERQLVLSHIGLLGPIELVILGLFLKFFFYRLDWNLISCTNEHLLFRLPHTNIIVWTGI